MTEHTSRLGLPKPDSDNSESPAGPAEIGALADAIDVAAVYAQGILSSRPVSTSGTPGIQGRLYYVTGDSTSANNGILWLDTGTGWVVVNGPGTIVDTYANRAAANGVPAGTKFFASDQVSEYVSNGSAWIRTSTPAGVVTVCLAATADPGWILLQGQAWPSSSGIYTDLYAKWAGSTLPSFNGKTLVGLLSGDADFGTLGQTGGEKKHQLNVSELPAFTVDIPYGVPNTGGGSSTTDVGAANIGSELGTLPSRSVGGGVSHNNLQPYRVVNLQAKL